MKTGGWKEPMPHPLKNAALMAVFLVGGGPGCGAVVAVASGAKASTGALGGLVFIGVVSLFVMPTLIGRGFRR